MGESKLPFCVRKVTAVTATVRVEAPEPYDTTYPVTRLLTTDKHGHGRHVQFLGFAQRRLSTHLLIVQRAERMARLCAPEWDPRVPIEYFDRLLPADAAPGTWISAKANLGAATAARLALSDLTVAPTFDPTGVLPPPAVTPVQPDRPRQTPPTGPGCGDIVALRDRDTIDRMLREDRQHGLQFTTASVFFGGLRPQISPGGRLYFARDRDVVGYVDVLAVTLEPRGARVHGGPFQPVHLSNQPALHEVTIGPGGGGAVVSGTSGWAWRSWLRSEEQPPPTEPLVRSPA